MSLKAILEVVVHLDTFRNIDLFFQGLYYVKVSVHSKKGEQVSAHLYRQLSWRSFFLLIWSLQWYYIHMGEYLIDFLKYVQI